MTGLITLLLVSLIGLIWVSLIPSRAISPVIFQVGSLGV